jgi:glycosyltransferase involved in cell wall biosynthesis
MSPDDHIETSATLTKGTPPAVLMVSHDEDDLRESLASVRRHSSGSTPIVTVNASSDAVDNALAELAPADVLVLSEPCRVNAAWIELMRAAAYGDTNTASASALASSGSALGLARDSEPASAQSVPTIAEHTLRLRPRLNVIVGPCIYLRRDALKLIGGLDCQLELRWALELDFAQRCLLAGLSHVAADDVLVEPLGHAAGPAEQPPAALLERYPWLARGAGVDSGDEPHDTPWSAAAASPVLGRALAASARGSAALSITIDGRSLGSAITGTHRHILELITALAASGELLLRVLVGPETTPATVEQLGALPGTEVLAIDEIDTDTPRSAIFHRPQQVFETNDLRLAMRLGERLVLNELDLIAYRNPGYHADAATWRRHRRVSRQALAAADRVIVSSNHTRAELLSDELTPADRIRIVPPGLDHRAPAVREVASAEYAVTPIDESLVQTPFMLCLGTDYRHKNRVFALRLLEELRTRHHWDGRLVFAGTHVPYGSSGGLEQDLLARHPGLTDAVIDLGPIDDQRREWLMAQAAAVAYPSVYEGFGLVPLEAALSGVPCLFASQSSLADTLPPQSAAIVPWDESESAARAHELLTDASAGGQQVRLLRAVANGFRWEDTARSTIEVYRDALVAPVREAAVLGRDEVSREHEMRELILAHDALVARLVREREHAQQMYDDLNREVGFSLSLIGPNGSLPDEVQRALLALSAKPGLSNPLYTFVGRMFRAARVLGRGDDSPDPRGRATG